MMAIDQLSDPHASLTDEEYFTLHGTLNRTRIEALLSFYDEADNTDAIELVEDAVATLSRLRTDLVLPDALAQKLLEYVLSIQESLELALKKMWTL